MKHISRMPIYFALFALLASVAYAKRMPPPPVAPVTANGVEYSADSDGRTGYVVATNIGSGNELWRVKLYHVHIKFWVEEDVQWVYITNLKLAGNMLLARDEKDRCYSIDVSTRKHREQSCGDEFASSSSR